MGYVRIECPGFATVTFNEQDCSCAATFGSGSTITCSAEGTYQVRTLTFDFQGCHILEKSWKVMDFFCCPGKSWKMLIKFSRDLPGQNVKFAFFIITGTL